ncbi:MAG: Cell division protein DedD [Herbaspirillum frisingense]|uniref:Cell division protein DedD n=1 Tax=Herbaspirillum frisingense TaxID=92645 RepID=A0A7V8FX34_9BURK|nr:MAG: Cell division protein DedD [Herbaspirillum frisingense]
MGLFSLFRKNKQDSASDQGEFRSRSEEQSSALRTRTSRAANTSGRAAGSGRGKAGKEAGADPLLPEKKRARRRLIGAVALALAVVIALPMILDSEPKPLNEDIAIQIPSKDQPATTAAATGAQPDAAQPAADNGKLASASSTLDQKEEIVEPASVSQPPPVAAPQPVTPPAASVAPTKPVEKPAAKPAAKPEEKKSTVVEHKDEPKKDAPKKETPKPKAAEQGSDDSARALAILEGKSGSAAAADKKPAASGGKFVIQVAALATQDKVNELRNKLSGAGIHSYTQKIATQGGDRTRIRVGPFGNRDEAEKMGARIKKLGLNATIVPA